MDIHKCFENLNDYITKKTHLACVHEIVQEACDAILLFKGYHPMIK